MFPVVIGLGLFIAAMAFLSRSRSDGGPPPAPPPGTAPMPPASTSALADHERVVRAAPRPPPAPPAPSSWATIETFPTPGMSPAPTTDTVPSLTVTPPAVEGPDAARAERLAPGLARHLASAGRSGYSRSRVREFQRAAGITVDGDYGPETRAALVRLGVANPPAVFTGGGAAAVVPGSTPVAESVVRDRLNYINERWLSLKREIVAALSADDPFRVQFIRDFNAWVAWYNEASADPTSSRLAGASARDSALSEWRARWTARSSG